MSPQSADGRAHTTVGMGHGMRLEKSENRDDTLLPRLLMAIMHAMAMKITRSEYSTRFAPASRCFFPCMTSSLIEPLYSYNAGDRELKQPGQVPVPQPGIARRLIACGIGFKGSTTGHMDPRSVNIESGGRTNLSDALGQNQEGRKYGILK